MARTTRASAIRVKRVVGMRLFAAAIVLGLALLGGTWWFARGPAVPVQHDPVSVLIADFQNRSNDTTFDGTLEPIVKLRAGGRRVHQRATTAAGIRRSLGVRPPEKLDERAAQRDRGQARVGVVLSGSIEPSGQRLRDLDKGDADGDRRRDRRRASSRASSKDQVLSVATQAGDSVREALGDDTSDAAQRFAMDNAVGHVPGCRARLRGRHGSAISNSKFEEARQHFSKAVERRPEVRHRLYGLAMASCNLDRQQDAREIHQAGIQHLDSMTERERYRTRGLYYLDHERLQAVRQGVRRARSRNIAADVVGAQQAGAVLEPFCAEHAGRREADAAGGEDSAQPRALPREPGAVRQLRRRFPERRTGGAAAEGAGRVRMLALAFAQIGQGQLAAGDGHVSSAADAIDPRGRRYMASGLADLAIYEGPLFGCREHSRGSGR